MSLKTTRSLVSLTVLSALTMVAANHAVAGDKNNNDTCHKAINATGMAVQGARFMGQDAERNQNRMMAHVMAADAMADMRRFDDVMQQMRNIRDMVGNMANPQNPQMHMLDAFGQDQIGDGIGGVDGMAAMAHDACQQHDRH